MIQRKENMSHSDTLFVLEFICYQLSLLWIRTSCLVYSHPQHIEILGWCPVGSILPHGEKVPLLSWLATVLVMVSQ